MISLSLAEQKNSILGLDDLSEQQNSILSLDDLSELGGRLGHLPRPQDALLALHQQGSDLGGSILPYLSSSSSSSSCENLILPDFSSPSIVAVLV